MKPRRLGEESGVMRLREAVEKPPSSASLKTLMELTSAGVRNCAMGRSAKVSVMAWNLIAVEEGN